MELTGTEFNYIHKKAREVEITIWNFNSFADIKVKGRVILENSSSWFIKKIKKLNKKQREKENFGLKVDDEYSGGETKITKDEESEKQIISGGEGIKIGIKK